MNQQTIRAAMLFAAALALCGTTRSAIIGTNIPANPLTLARIAALPPEQQPAWRSYFEKSARQMAADRAHFQDEMKSHGLKQPIAPPPSKSAGGVTLKETDAWYAGAEAGRIADIIVSFQTPAGGWSKHLNMSKNLRAPGESYGTDNNSRFLQAGDFDKALDSTWHYIGTFDNDATITQLRFLAKVITATHGKNGAYAAAFSRGLDYVFNSQYPTGGWPQVWPLEGGYHDAITLNDDAMLHVVQLLQDVSQGGGEYSFVPAESRAKCADSLKRGIECILAMQIVTNGVRTVWCQQNDPITLIPTSARNYEMPSQTSSESAEMVLFFMKMPQPSPQIIASVHAAALWFRKTGITGKAYKLKGKEGRHLIDDPGNGGIWARYYEIGTDRPIFGDRDRTIHDNVDEISKERRNGYGWYRDTPKRLLEHYKRWSSEHPQ